MWMHMVQSQSNSYNDGAHPVLHLHLVSPMLAKRDFDDMSRKFNPTYVHCCIAMNNNCSGMSLYSALLRHGCIVF